MIVYMYNQADLYRLGVVTNLGAERMVKCEIGMTICDIAVLTESTTRTLSHGKMCSSKSRLIKIAIQFAYWTLYINISTVKPNKYMNNSSFLQTRSWDILD